MLRSRVKLAFAAVLLLAPLLAFFVVDTVALDEPVFFVLFILAPIAALTVSLMTWRSGPHHVASAIVFFASLAYGLLLIAGALGGLDAQIFLHNYCSVDAPLECEAVSVSQEGEGTVSFIVRNVGGEPVSFAAVSLEDGYPCSVAPADLALRGQAFVQCGFAPRSSGRVELLITIASSAGERVVTVYGRL